MKPRRYKISALLVSMTVLALMFQNCGESRLVLPQSSSQPSQEIVNADIGSLSDINAFVSDEITIAPNVSGNIDLQSPETTFVWLKNGTPIAGENSSEMILQAQSIADAGIYTFQIYSRGEMLSSVDVNVSLSHHTSCLEIINANSLKPDGNYTVDIDGEGGATAPVNVYCDMTTDSGGWTLIARVLANSTIHTSALAVGSLDGPDQQSTAKLADDVINLMTFTHLRMNIENTITTYFQTSTVDLTGDTNFNLPNQAAESFAGPYNLIYSTQNNCGSDCIVAGIQQTVNSGRFCGYRYLVSQNNPAPGMGCENTGGNRAGHVWVR